MSAATSDRATLIASLCNVIAAAVADRLQIQAGSVEEVVSDVLRNNGDVKASISAVVQATRIQPELQDAVGTKKQFAETPPPADVLKTRQQSFPSRETTGPTSESRYRVIKPHAKGGLGEVFVAEDKELGRRVALKEIQARFAGDTSSRTRFVLEAEVTGGLEHPGIVPVYGLGHYPDGRPYYAMRFVQGDNLREALRRFHGDSHSFNSIEFRQLLRRFVDVCNAVGYAHSRGVLHRDLKPGNVMLGQYGETLLVDWGLAKATGKASRERERPEVESERAPLQPRSGDTGLTIQGLALGTPAYMSPEQARGEFHSLGPAADIYSLGATLYELLTNRVPFPDADEDAIKSGRFPPPRSVKPTVPRALEAVCLKAMAFGPEDRYASALNVTKEIEQWLGDEPVTAYREPLRVRVRRWLKRHRTLVTAGAVGLVLLAAGLGGLAWEEKRAGIAIAKERDEAVKQKRRTRTALDTMVSAEMVERMGMQKNLTRGQREFLQTAQAYYQEFAAEAAGDEEGRSLEAGAQFRIGFLLISLGQHEEAVSAFSRALHLYEKLASDFPAVPQYRSDLAMSRNNLGLVYSELGRWAEAEAAYRAALVDREKLTADFPTMPDVWANTADSHNKLGHLLWRLRRWPDAETAFRAALTTREKLIAIFPTVSDYRRDLAQGQSDLGVILRDVGRRNDAETAHRAALAVREKLVADFPDVPKHRRDTARSQVNLGLVLSDLGRLSEAEAAQRAARAALEKLSAEFPALPEIRNDLVASLSDLGVVLKRRGRWAEAEASFRAAVDVSEKLATDFPSMPEFRALAANTQCNLGNLFKDLGQWGDAEVAYRAAIPLQWKLATDGPAVPGYRQDLANTQRDLGGVLWHLGRRSDAMSAYQEALTGFEKLVVDFPTMADYRRDLAQSRAALGGRLRDLGRLADAEAAYRAAITVFQKLTSDFPAVPKYRRGLAESLNDLGIVFQDMRRRADAEATYRAAIVVQEKLMSDFPGVSDYALGVGAGYCNVGNLVREGGDAAAALELHDKAISVLAPLVATEPRFAIARRFLRNSHFARANDLVRLRKFAHALPDWDAALRFDDGSLRLAVRIGRADCLARLGRAADAVREAGETADDAVATFAVVYDCACAVSVASDVRKSPEADTHAARAVVLLRQAIAKGYSDIPHMLADSDFAPLRKRAAYADLLWGIADAPAR
jgi:serine/threonine-protein kinase